MDYRCNADGELSAKVSYNFTRERSLEKVDQHKMNSEGLVE